MILRDGLQPPALEEGHPLALVSELALGANNRDMTEENFEDGLEDGLVEEVLEVTETPPNVFFVPKLLTAPVKNVLVDDNIVSTRTQRNRKGSLT